MNNTWNNQAIGAIVTHLPAAAELFKASRIDFCQALPGFTKG